MNHLQRGYATGIGLFIATAASAAPNRQLQVRPGDLKWEQPFGPSGPRRADVVGDKNVGPYSFFLELPAGYDSGWHTHDTPYTAVVLSGTVENIEQGEAANAAPLIAGSVWSQPAQRNHMTRCSHDKACLVYISGPGGESFHPMSADGKPLLPAPK